MWVLGVFICWRLQFRFTSQLCTTTTSAAAPASTKLFWGAYVLFPKYRAVFCFMVAIGMSFSEMRFELRNLGRGGYETFVTFESCPLTYSHRDLLLKTIFTISYPKILSCRCRNILFLLLSPLLAPYGIFNSFLLSESTYLGGTHCTGCILDSAQTMHWPAENFIKIRNSVESVEGYDYAMVNWT